MSRTHTIQIEAQNTTKLPLGELRWLVQQLEGAPDTLEVKVTTHESTDQRDSSSAKLSAEAPDRPVKPHMQHRPPAMRGAAGDQPHPSQDGHP